ncbi:MAG: MFS transporter [Actinocrinis sp.]
MSTSTHVVTESGADPAHTTNPSSHESSSPRTPASTGAPRRVVMLLAIACGLTVANLYYIQPLLPEIAKAFSTSESAAGTLVTALQAGYGVALLLIVPLGDITRRRTLVCILLLIEAVTLGASAAAPNFAALLAFSTAVGIAACVVQILLPYAATIAADHERGRVTATVFSGLLIGVLLSRTVSGLAGQAFGWRTVLAGAGVLMVILAAVLARAMDGNEAEVSITYVDQLKSTVRLARTEPVLRRRAVVGGFVFAAFSVFWTTISFLLAGAPYHYNQATIGLFALVGGAGATAAKLTGRAADRGLQGPASAALLVAGIASFGAIALGGHHLIWLLIGVLVMDAAVQGVNLLNLSVVYGLAGGARARIASVYMTTYFVFGAVGSAVGDQAYRLGGWTAVSASGAIFTALALAVWAWDAAANRRDAALASTPACRHS